jgi:hypothetical protein
MSVMWLLQCRRVEQPAVDSSHGWLVIALDGPAGIAVSPGLTLGSAPVGGQVSRLVSDLPWARSGDERPAQRVPATAAARRRRRRSLRPAAPAVARGLATPMAAGAPS